MKMRSYVAMCVAVVLLSPHTDAQSQEDGAISRWDGQRWVRQEGAGVRIAVDPNGSPWVINSSQNIYRWQNGAFQQLPGKAKDIAVGARTAWIIGSDDGVYQWNGSAWNRVPGSGTAISVDRSGSPWVVNATGDIFQWDGSRFVRRSGGARDIGGVSDVWIVGTDGGIHRWSRNGWTPIGGGGMRVSGGAPGTAWVVNEAGHIYRWQNGAFEQLPGAATDIAANARGDAWIISASAPSEPASSLLLFREPEFRGQSFPVSGPVRTVPGAFGQARSLQVRGGVWEVCESPRFRGQCVTVTSDVADLELIGLRNAVGSVRPRRGAAPW